jgi:hypothetical protein
MRSSRPLTRADLFRRLAGRPPVADEERVDLAQLERYVVPEEERMMGWMSLRRQLVQALNDNDSDRLARYVSASCRSQLDLASLLGASIENEEPRLEVVSADYLSAGTALYTIRERDETALARLLFSGGRLEAYIQVVAGDWHVRELNAV